MNLVEIDFTRRLGPSPVQLAEDFVYEPEFKTAPVRIGWSRHGDVQMTIGNHMMTSAAFFRFDEFPAHLRINEKGAWACLAAGEGEVLGRIRLSHMSLDVVIDHEGYIYSLSIARRLIPEMPRKVREFIERTAETAPTIQFAR